MHLNTQKEREKHPDQADNSDSVSDGDDVQIVGETSQQCTLSK